MSELKSGAEQFKAFADPTRLRILSLLERGELCVCHIVDVLGEGQPKVSRHLAILRHAGLVTARVEGPWRHYALPAGASGLTATLLHCVHTCLQEIDELQADLRRLEKVRPDLACGAQVGNA